MIDHFLLLGLPYVALGLFVVGIAARFRRARFTVSSMSSQFLEHRALRWGSTAWHVGIVVILGAHTLALGFPWLWGSLMAVKGALVTVEVAGVCLTLLSTAGLIVLIVRRLTSARLQHVTSVMDLVVLALLLVQICLGLAVALNYRWGAVWATGTLAPYLWSVVTLAPDVTFVADMPPLVKAHLAGAWVLVALVPYSRLAHVLVVPVSYLVRAPQVVVWSNLARAQRAVAAQVADSRRLFLRGTVATASGVALLGVGVLDKLVRYFQGPSLTEDQTAGLMEEKLTRIKATVEQRELELERIRSEYISICRVSDLEPARGRYFTDFAMRPALAFRGVDGLPLLVSAKCTHLGCTVGNEVTMDGKLLCPCHVSYFDVRTGVPNPGAPAKAPLEHLDWVVMDATGTVVARRTNAGLEGGQLDPALLGACEVFIARRRSEEV